MLGTSTTLNLCENDVGPLATLATLKTSQLNTLTLDLTKTYFQLDVPVCQTLHDVLKYRFGNAERVDS